MCMCVCHGQKKFKTDLLLILVGNVAGDLVYLYVGVCIENMNYYIESLLLPSSH